MKKIVYAIFVIIILMISVQCKAVKEKNSMAYDSLYVDYISTYTSGTISKRDTIEVNFANNFDSSSIAKDGVLNEGVMKIEPKVKGSFLLDSGNKIVFHPDDLLNPGTQYSIKINLKAIYNDVPEELSEFVFNVHVLESNFEVILNDVAFYKENEIEYQSILGYITTSDKERATDVEKILGISQKIEWNHEPQNIYRFVIRGLERKENTYDFKITYNGASIGVSKKGSTNAQIYGIKGFSYIDYKLTTTGDSQIALFFSNKIDSKIHIKDYITVKNATNYSLRQDGNKLIVFLGQSPQNTIEIMISKELKDENGNLLGEDVEIVVVLSQEKPLIKYSDNQHGVLPSSSGFVIPFQAISLKAVDITVVEIYHNNMVQFFQSNENLEGNEQITRVGRPVLYKTISLASKGFNLYQWNTFNLDLSQFISTRPGAMYQIRINFRKSQSLYTCSEGEAEEVEDEILKENFDAPYGYGYWDYDYYDGDWDERENPCNKAYYGRRRQIYKNIIASDLGIIVKGSDNNEYIVAVSDIKTSEPVKQADVTFLNYQNKIISEGKTDNNGIFKTTLDHSVFVITAAKGNNKTFVKVDAGSAITLSRFDVGGTENKKGIKAFIYGDRGVWRPGDNIYLNCIIYDSLKKLPLNHPVVFELYNPSGVRVQKITKNVAVGGIYNFNTSTDSDAETGIYEAKIRVGDEVFSKSLKIETIKPNRLNINLDFRTNSLHKNNGLYTPVLKVNWLHGAVAKNMKTEINVVYSSSKTVFDNYIGYDFDDPTKQLESEELTLFVGEVNSEGNAVFDFNPPTISQAPGMLRADFITRVMEDGGDFSTDTFHIPYYPYKSFVGLKTPPGDAARGMLLTDQDHKIEIASVDSQGNPISLKNLRVSVYKLSWRWWWDTSYDDKANFTSSGYSSKISTDRINTVNGKSTYVFRVNQPEWGRYFIHVEDPASGHSSGKVVFVDWPGWAGAAQKGDKDGENILAFYTDKQEYNVGEIVKCTIPSSSKGRVFVNIESGSKSLENFWVQSEQGKTEFTFSATQYMSPNVYIHITLLQPYDNDNNLPIRLYGIVPIKVVNKNTQLKPVVEIADELTPEKEVVYKIKEASGKPMSYTVAVVDEGLLNLTNYKTPDPWASFYSKEAIGIRTWDVYDEVIGGYAKLFGTKISIGGGGEFTPPAAQKANRFEPVVRFFGPFTLKANSTNSHSFVMPRYVGAVRTMVVAENSGSFGNAEKTSLVKESLMVLGTLPRVLGPSESVSLPVNVFMLEDGKNPVNVSIKTEGLLEIENEKSKTIVFNSSGDQFVYFNLKTANKIGFAKVYIEATSGNHKAFYEIELDVRPSNPLITRAATQIIESGKKIEYPVELYGIEGTNQLSVELSYLPAISLNKRLEYLMGYPHGCLEQIVSGVFPQLYLSSFINLNDEQKRTIETNVNAGIEKIKKFRILSGGFSYWPGNGEPSEWATNYAGHFLIAARDKGYAVPQSMLNEWADFQKNTANKWNDGYSNEYDMVQAYRLYTLALYNKPVYSAMNRLRDKKDIDVRVKWILASSYILSGNLTVAENIIKGLSDKVKQTEYSSTTFGSNERDRAMILETLVLLKKYNEGLAIYNELAEVLGSDAWLSTQSSAYILIALASYGDKISKGDSLLGTYVFGADKGTIDSTAPYWMKKLKAENGVLSIENKGNSTMFAKITRQGIPLSQTEISEEKNISMNIVYRDKDQNIINDISSLKQGTTIIVETILKNQSPLGLVENIALTHIMPSGWEILNMRTQGIDLFQRYSDYDYQDIRDDRVLTYFKLNAGESKSFRFMINASYVGKFYYPGVNLEAMYNDSIYSRKKGMSISVIK